MIRKREQEEAELRKHPVVKKTYKVGLCLKHLNERHCISGSCAVNKVVCI